VSWSALSGTGGILGNSTWDCTTHARVVFMPGHHRVAQSFLVWYAFNLTLLGSTSSNHTLHDTRHILHIASIWFHNINYLNLTGIIVITSYELKASPFAALEFTNIFTSQVSQIAVHSESSGVDIKNVLGNSVIEHSSFDTISHLHGAHISINFSDRPVENLIMLILNKIPAKISIQDCIFTNAVGQSISAFFFLNSLPVQIDISNIATLGQQENDIMPRLRTYAQYTITIRDSLLDNDGRGVELLLLSSHTHLVLIRGYRLETAHWLGTELELTLACIVYTKI